MELGHLITGQIILISSLIATVTLSESNKYAATLRYLTNIPSIKVSGEKGAILLLFAVSIIILIFMHFFSSQAKIHGFKKLSRKAKKAKNMHVECLLIAFITFLTAYIFQNLNFRIYNLLGAALILMNLNTILYFIGIELIMTWFYLSFVICIGIVMCFTFINNSEKYYSIAVSYISIKF